VTSQSNYTLRCVQGGLLPADEKTENYTIKYTGLMYPTSLKQGQKWSMTLKTNSATNKYDYETVGSEKVTANGKSYDAWHVKYSYKLTDGGKVQGSGTGHQWVVDGLGVVRESSTSANGSGATKSTSETKAEITSVAEAMARFDGRRWRVGYDEANDQQHIIEYVLPGESVKEWSELVTHQIFTMENDAATLKRMAGFIEEGLKRDCPGAKWKTVKQSKSEILYEWTAEDCGGVAYDHEFARLAKCSKGVCRWGWEPHKEQSSEQLKAWQNVVMKLDMEKEP
jgi:hypothetical protein